MYRNELGWIATILTFIYKFPQVYKLYKLKNVKGVSIVSYNIQTLGSIAYIVHGQIIKDYPVMIMGIETLILNIILCLQYYYYDRLNSTS